MAEVLAFGLVCNVFQLVEYAFKLVSVASDIYRSADGAVPENRETESCVRDLLESNSQLTGSLEKPQGPDDAALRKLASECSEIALELAGRLQSYRGEGTSKKKSVWLAIKYAYNKDELDALKKRIESYRVAIDSRMLQSLRSLGDQQIHMLAAQKRDLANLDDNDKRILEAVNQNGRMLSSQLNSHMNVLLQQILTRNERLLGDDDDSQWDFIQRPQTKAAESIFLLAEQGNKRDLNRFLRDHPEALRAYDADGRTALHFAVQSGSSDVVDYLLFKGADVNADDDDISTPLHLAATSGSAAITRSLLHHGAIPGAKDINGKNPLQLAAAQSEVWWVLAFGVGTESRDETGNTALCHFARRGEPDIVSSFLAQNANVEAPGADGMRPLLYAAQEGHDEVVRLLLEAGADVNSSSESPSGLRPLGLAAWHDRKSVVQLLLDHGADINGTNTFHWTALGDACFQRHEEVSLLLVQRGASISGDADGCTILQRASMGGLFRLIRELVEVRRVDVNAKGRWNWTALHEACSHARVDIIEYLLNHGADPNVQEGLKKATPLLRATHASCAPGVALLLDNKRTDINAQNAEGWTALMRGVHCGFIDIVSLLLGAGARTEIASADGRTPLCMAAAMGNRAMVRLLVKRGGASVDAQVPAGPGRLTPLLESVIAGHASVVSELLSLDADANAFSSSKSFENGRQYSPLLFAARAHQKKILKILLNEGHADVNAAAADGSTALGLACLHGNPDVVRVLLEYGADKRTAMTALAASKGKPDEISRITAMMAS